MVMVVADKNARKRKKQNKTKQKTKNHDFVTVAILLSIGKIKINEWFPWDLCQLFIIDLTSDALNKCSF